MGEKESADLLPGTLYMMILQTLSQGPLHGYAIAKRIRHWSKGDLEIEDGSLYPALNRMLIKGWVKAEWGMTDNNRRARSEEHTSELQSLRHLVCRLLLEKKKKNKKPQNHTIQ